MGYLYGPLELVTPPAALAVSVEDAKSQCKIEVTTEDARVEDYLWASQEFCELEIPGGRQIMPATFDLPLACWWGDEPLKLPRPPLGSVTSVKYRDSSDVEQTLSASLYEVRTPWRQPGWISWLGPPAPPALSTRRVCPVTVRFVAGYASAAAVPKTVRQAILMLTGHFHEHREAVIDTGSVPMAMRLAVESLLNANGWGAYA